MVSKFLFNFCNFSIIVCFLNKLLTSGILFSTALNAVFVAKLLISGILFCNSVSYSFLTNSVTLGILFSNSYLSVSYLVFKTKPLASMLFTLETNLHAFLTTSFFTTLLSLLKPVGTGTNLPMSNLSTSVFRLAKFVFNPKPDRSTCEIFLMPHFVA